jgi:hypothetical protein
MKSDTPIHTDSRGRWRISSPAGREIAAGHVFDEGRGYRVTLKYSDSSNWNSLSVEAARTVVADMRGQNVRNADAVALAAEIERWAGHCERLNAGWAFMGSPPGGFDTMAHGSA